MTRQQLNTLPVTEQIMFRSSGKIGYPAPSTKEHREALKQLLRDGHIKSVGYPQNSMTEYFRAI